MSTENINCSLSISQIIVNSLTAEWIKKIRNFASIINENIEEIHNINDDASRFNKILELLEFNETDYNKIVKAPVKSDNTNTTDKSKNTKTKKTSSCPIPFLHIVTKSGKLSCTTVKDDCCQALVTQQYLQCTEKKANNSDYCVKCNKKLNENGIPKMGNIKMRCEQFQELYYKFKTPDGKNHNVYFGEFCEKKNFTNENVLQVLNENIKIANNGGQLSPEKKQTYLDIIMFKREKKEKKVKKSDKKTSGLTDDMENNDDDDNQSTTTDDNDDNQSTATNDDNDDNQSTTTDDDDDDNDEDGVQFAQDDEETYDITNYAIMKTKTAKYGMLKEDYAKVVANTKSKKNDDVEYEIYEIADYVDDNDFKLVDFKNSIGFVKNGKMSLHKK